MPNTLELVADNNTRWDSFFYGPRTAVSEKSWIANLWRKSIANGTVLLLKIVALADFMMVREDLRYLTARLLVRTGK
jgi:hypothetical protein